MLISAILCVQCNTSMLYSVTEDKGWPTSAFLGRQPPVSQVEELHVTIEIIPTRFVQNLQVLIVENCYQLEHVFDLDDGHVGLLPKLAVLVLIDLPKLRHICNCGSSRNHFPSSMASAPVGNIIFPKLSDITLESLPNLTSFVSPGYHSLQRLHHADLDTPFPVLFDERVSLSLRILLFLILMILIFLLTLLSIKLLEENKENLD